jgi:transcriptional regulator with GAF, ATPase, and Fis domain
MIKAVIAFKVSDTQSMELRLDKSPITIGRSEECDLVLPGKSVSRRHVRLCLTPIGVSVEDMSVNGTFIGGRRISKTVLTSDTDVAVGPFILHVKIDTGGLYHIEEDTSIITCRTFSDIVKPLDEGLPPGAAQSPADLGLIGRSGALEHVLQLMAWAAATELPALITGETGTGKELVARGIHSLSSRADRVFVAINCAAISPELVESELFGHEKGAFTGAVTRRTGAFEYASQGTLLLDEIGEMPLPMQPKLLRVLESFEIRRVGGNESIPTHARILATTNKDLQEEVGKGSFRKDLFYRLRAFTIEIPPLRERAEDVEVLAVHFLEEFNARQGTRKILKDSAAQPLRSYPWPGNVRQLKNFIHYAAAVSKGDAIDARSVHDLLEGLEGEEPPCEVKDGETRGGPSKRIEEIEREAILEELRRTNWNKAQTARNLGIAKSTLFSKINKYGIKPP